MKFWILASFLVSWAPSIETANAPGSVPSILVTHQEGGYVRFNLDFGAYKIFGAQAYLNEEFLSLRLPASISKSGTAYEELDFADPNMRRIILDALKNPTRINPGNEQKSRTSLRLAWLEKVNSSRGSRLAKGELWLDGAVAVRFSLMKSKWSASPSGWWVAYPSQWQKKSGSWEDLFVIKEKSLKKEIARLISDAYLERYWDEDE